MPTPESNSSGFTGSVVDVVVGRLVTTTTIPPSRTTLHMTAGVKGSQPATTTFCDKCMCCVCVCEVCADLQVYGWMDGWMDGVRWIDGTYVHRADGVDRWIGRQKGRRIDRQLNRQI